MEDFIIVYHDMSEIFLPGISESFFKEHLLRYILRSSFQVCNNCSPIFHDEIVQGSYTYPLISSITPENNTPIKKLSPQMGGNLNPIEGQTYIPDPKIP